MHCVISSRRNMSYFQTFLTILVVCVFVDSSSCDCICGYIPNINNPTLCYKLKTVSVLGIEARVQCEDDGGYLATGLDLHVASWLFVDIFSANYSVTPWTGVQFDVRTGNWITPSGNVSSNYSGALNIDTSLSGTYTVLNTTTMTLNSRPDTERNPSLCVMNSINGSTVNTVTDFITLQIGATPDVVSMYHTVTEYITVPQTNVPTSSTSVPMDGQCQHNHTNPYSSIELELKLQTLTKDLTVSKTELSSVKRKYVSAPDGRKSSYVMGSTAACLISLPFIFVFFTDVPRFLQSIKPKRKVRVRKIKVASATTC